MARSPTTDRWSTLSAAISGAGAFNVLAGTAVLTSDSSGFAGTTTVSSGSTLQVGNGGTSGALGGAITNNGTLTYNRTDASTLSGAIAGTGTFNVLTGAAVLTSDSSGFAGATKVSSGSTLQIGSGGTSGTLGGAITNDGTLTYNRTDASTLSGAIAGAGAFNVLTGTVVLNR